MFQVWQNYTSLSLLSISFLLHNLSILNPEILSQQMNRKLRLESFGGYWLKYRTDWNYFCSFVHFWWEGSGAGSSFLQIYPDSPKSAAAPWSGLDRKLPIANCNPSPPLQNKTEQKEQKSQPSNEQPKVTFSKDLGMGKKSQELDKHEHILKLWTPQVTENSIQSPKKGNTRHFPLFQVIRTGLSFMIASRDGCLQLFLVQVHVPSWDFPFGPLESPRVRSEDGDEGEDSVQERAGIGHEQLLALHG